MAAVYFINSGISSPKPRKISIKGHKYRFENNVLAVLMPDGTQINHRHFNPCVNWEKEYWTSIASKQKYPVKWTADISELDLKLEIVPVIKEQEIVSTLGELNKYEGCCTVYGTRNGQEVSGTALVELIGHWRP